MTEAPPAYHITIKLTFFQVELKNQTHLFIKDTFESFRSKYINQEKVIFNILWPTTDNAESVVPIIEDLNINDVGWNINSQTITELHNEMHHGRYYNFIHQSRLFISYQGVIVRFDIHDLELEKLQVLTNEMIQVKNELAELKKAYTESQRQLAFFTTESGLFFKMMIDKCLIDWSAYNPKYSDGKIYYTFYASKLDKPLETEFALVEHIIMDEYYYVEEATLIACKTCSSSNSKVEDRHVFDTSNYRRLKLALQFIKDYNLNHVKTITVGNHVNLMNGVRGYNITNLTQIREYRVKNSGGYFICGSHRSEWIKVNNKPWSPEVCFDYVEMTTLNKMDKITLTKLECYLINYSDKSKQYVKIMDSGNTKNGKSICLPNTDYNTLIIDCPMDNYKQLINVSWVDN